MGSGSECVVVVVVSVEGVGLWDGVVVVVGFSTMLEWPLGGVVVVVPFVDSIFDECGGVGDVGFSVVVGRGATCVDAGFIILDCVAPLDEA